MTITQNRYESLKMVETKKEKPRNPPREKTRKIKKVTDTQQTERNLVKNRIEVYGILVIMISLLLLISVFIRNESGVVLRYINYFLSYLFGVGKYFFSIFILFWGVSFFFKKSRFLKIRLGIGFVIFFLSLIGIFSNTKTVDSLQDRLFFTSKGGITGSGIYSGLLKLTNKAAALTILIFFLLLSLLIITNISIVDIFKKITAKIREAKKRSEEKKYITQKTASKLAPEIQLHPDKDALRVSYREETPFTEPGLLTKKPGFFKDSEKKSFPFIRDHVKNKTGYDEEADFLTSLKERKKTADTADYRERSKNLEADLSNENARHNKTGSQLKMPIEGSSKTEDYYRLPPDSLLKKSKLLSPSLYRQDMKENIYILNNLFRDFNLAVKVASVIRGPSVTLYELSISPGVKVQKLLSLEDDFCVALGSSDIRILTPIPGKSAIGIEVPNKIKSIVTLGDVFSFNSLEKSKSPLKLPLGKNLSGDIISMDIRAMPHILIAGSTNSGKSSCINSLIISLLLKVKPDEVKFIMIDPKMVELSIYNGIPHLLAPIVINPKKAAVALSWAVEEMENRLKILSDYKCKNLEQFNYEIEKNKLTDSELVKLPYILIIIDELADLMLVAASEVEESINRIARMGRAVGLHLVIATQRPSVDVITGVIKANIPSRIAFNVASNTDSRVILDMSGAEKLIGRGDMLYLPVSMNRPERIQGAFVTSGEIEIVTDYIKSQKKDAVSKDLFAVEIKPEKKEIEDDSLIYEAFEIFIEFGHASASLLQRRLRIGYSRAARIVDQLENKGFISGYDGAKPREILVSKEDFLKFKEDLGL